MQCSSETDALQGAEALASAGRWKRPPHLHGNLSSWRLKTRSGRESSSRAMSASPSLFRRGLWPGKREGCSQDELACRPPGAWWDIDIREPVLSHSRVGQVAVDGHSPGRIKTLSGPSALLFTGSTQT